MKKLLPILFLFIATNAFASPPSRVATYTSGTIISSTDVTANEDSIFNYLQAGVDTYSPLSIDNGDIDATANIQSDKLNLTSIAQAVGITSGGSLTNAGTFTQSGNATFLGSTVANLGTVTTAAFTAISNLGAVANTGTITTGGKITAAANEIEGSAFDINGGTMDGVNVDGQTATGVLFVNDSSDDMSGLGAQGTTGQFLKSAGAGSNPTFADASQVFVETATFSAATVPATITETISAGDVYMLVVEGVTASNTWSGSIRINGDSDGGNEFVVHGVTFTGSGSTVTRSDDADDDETYIPFINATDSIPAGSSFYYEAIITARASDTQVQWVFSSSLADSEQFSVNGRGHFKDGTPTSIAFNRNQGTGTVTGRTYLYKFGTTP